MQVSIHKEIEPQAAAMQMPPPPATPPPAASSGHQSPSASMTSSDDLAATQVDLPLQAPAPPQPSMIPPPQLPQPQQWVHAVPIVVWQAVALSADLNRRSMMAEAEQQRHERFALMRRNIQQMEAMATEEFHCRELIRRDLKEHGDLLQRANRGIWRLARERRTDTLRYMVEALERQHPGEDPAGPAAAACHRRQPAGARVRVPACPPAAR